MTKAVGSHNKLFFTPERLFLFVALLFGLAFVVVTPPFQSPDEPAHFFRALQISDFSLLGAKDKNVSGGYIPKAVVDMTNDLNGHKTFTARRAVYLKKADTQKIKKYLCTTQPDEGYTLVDFRNTVIYPPVVYLPQTLGIGVARLLSLPPLWMLYLGRLFNLLFFISFVYLGIKTTPLYKYGLLLFALMPMALAQAASLSADATTFSLSFLLFAYILKLTTDKDLAIGWLQILTLTLISTFLSLSKYAYILLPALFFIIPKEKFATLKQRILYFTVIIFVSGVASILWFEAIKSIYLPFMSYSNPMKQLLFMEAHPLFYLQTIASTLSLGNMHAFVGNLGWLSTPVPMWLCICYLAVAFLNALLEDDNLHFSWKQIGWVALVLLASYCFLCTIVYVTTSKAGECYIWGIQGRYFIPLAPLLLLLFNWHCKWEFISIAKFFYNKNKVYILAPIPFITLALSIGVLIFRYY